MQRPLVYWIVERYVGNFHWVTCCITQDEEKARQRYAEIELEVYGQSTHGVRLARVGNLS